MMKKHSCYRIFVEMKVIIYLQLYECLIFSLNIIACLSIMFSYIG